MKRVVVLAFVAFSCASCAGVMMNAAISQRDLPRIQEKLSGGYNVNSRDRFEGVSALMWAATTGWAEGVAALLDAGANPNLKDNTGATALMRAAGVGMYTIPLWGGKGTNYREVCELLTDHGADVNVQDERGTTALMYAAPYRDREVLGCLLEHGADKTVRNADGLYAWTFAALGSYHQREGNVQTFVDQLMEPEATLDPDKAFLFFPAEFIQLSRRGPEGDKELKSSLVRTWRRIALGGGSSAGHVAKLVVVEPGEINLHVDLNAAISGDDHFLPETPSRDLRDLVVREWGSLAGKTAKVRGQRDLSLHAEGGKAYMLWYDVSRLVGKGNERSADGNVRLVRLDPGRSRR